MLLIHGCKLHKRVAEITAKGVKREQAFINKYFICFNKNIYQYIPQTHPIQ